MTREEFSLLHIDNRGCRILEIAPSFNPMYPRADGWNTEIIDYLDTESLINWYEGRSEKIEKVDYVCSRDYAEAVGKTKWYDIVVASHVIEHSIDLIGFLNDCDKMLSDDGIIKLVIPDKRYICDCFKEVTSTRVAVDEHIYRKGAICHSMGTMIEDELRDIRRGTNTYVPDKYLLQDGYSFYRWEGKKDNPTSHIRGLREKYDENTFINRHAWVFTPESFGVMVYELNLLGFINVKTTFIHSDRNSSQFFVELKKGQETMDATDYRRRLLGMTKESITENEHYYALELLKKSKNRNPGVYIYGIGIYSSVVEELLMSNHINYHGYVVSDGYKSCDYHKNYPVYELSDLDPEGNVIILMGVKKTRNEIEVELEKRGFLYLF